MWSVVAFVMVTITVHVPIAPEAVIVSPFEASLSAAVYTARLWACKENESTLLETCSWLSGPKILESPQALRPPTLERSRLRGHVCNRVHGMILPALK